jgi:hypothetical protein
VGDAGECEKFFDKKMKINLSLKKYSVKHHSELLELFYVLTAALVIFIIMELIWPDVVLAYINLNWVLLLWLVCGIIIL